MMSWWKCFSTDKVNKLIKLKKLCKKFKTWRPMGLKSKKQGCENSTIDFSRPKKVEKKSFEKKQEMLYILFPL